MSKPGPFIPCPTLCLPRLLFLLPSTSKDVREIELGSLWAGQGGGEREYPVAQIPFLASSSDSLLGKSAPHWPEDFTKGTLMGLVFLGEMEVSSGTAA